MTATAAARPPEHHTWFTPSPGPIAALVHPTAMTALAYDLRSNASRHGDTAWIHPKTSRDADPIANIGLDLLDAIGAVGLSQPRSVGERHLLRPLVHLVHGPVRHVFVDDVGGIDAETLSALHEATLVAQTQLWLLIDTADRPRRPSTTTIGLLEWVSAACTVIAADRILDLWGQREPARCCPPPPPAWWHEPLPKAAWTSRCEDVCHASEEEQVDCLLGQARRALTAGHVTATHVRGRLVELTNHPETTVGHRWALTAASRDHWTPGADALRQTHPDAQAAALDDVAPNGEAVRIDDTWVRLDPRHRLAVARLRTSRRLAGCLGTDPIDGVFENDRQGAYMTGPTHRQRGSAAPEGTPAPSWPS